MSNVETYCIPGVERQRPINPKLTAECEKAVKKMPGRLRGAVTKTHFMKILVRMLGLRVGKNKVFSHF